MKRALSCILALVLTISIIPRTLLTAYTGEIKSNNYTFTSIDGNSIYIKPSQSEVTVLIFGVCYSSNTADLVNSVANSDWVNCNEIRTVYIECSNEYCSSKTAVQDFANSIDDSDIIYCYDSSSGRMESYNALAHYLENASGSGIEVIFPMVVLLDEYNHIKDVSQDVMSARNIINKISLFADVNYTKSTANVNVSGQENYNYAYEVLDQLNELRRDLNLSALTMDEKLLDAAMQRAAEISVYFSHTRPNGEDCLTILEYLADATTLGENIAMKQTTPKSAMESWISSSGHYANMINSEYQSVGIGCFKTSNGVLHWVQMFSSTSSDGIIKTGTQSAIKTIEVSKSKILLDADLSKESVIANGNDTSQLDVYLFHSDAQEGEFAKLDPSSFNYSSTNTLIANINEQGVITSQLSGHANVTASLKDDNDISISKAISSSIEVKPDLKYGADRFSFGENITGYVGDEIDTLVVYTTANENISSLDISSSNSSVVEIGTIEIGNGEYITDKNECIATIPLKLKKKGNATITIISPENISTSITVSVEQVSYEIKMYAEIPTLVVGEGRTIGAALQLERNGTLVEDTCKYSFVSSNTDVITVSNIRNEKDGVYFYINGHKSGVAKLTITEMNTGALYSALIQVNNGIITYNAEALPTYYDRDAECNGFVNGMYMDEFSSTQKNDTTLSVSFNVYNTTSLVGVVDVYDKNNKLITTYPIKRYDGGIVSSVYETIKEGYYLIKDIVTGDILTYKQSSYSQKTEIKNIDVPIGGRIEITNDINYSDSCCVLNMTELSITTILTIGDTIKGLSSSDIKKVAEKSSVTIFKNEIASKLPEIATEFRKNIIQSITEDARNVIVADALNIVSGNTLKIFESFDIDFTKIIIDSAASLGVGIVEDAFVAATAFIGAALKGMFIVADYLELSCFIMQIAVPRSDKAMKIYFDDENGCLVSNGVSIKAQDGTIDLSESNFVMRSIVLSNDEDLDSKIKQSLDEISNDYVVRDIYLERDGVVSQPGQTVQVYMPIPDNYNPNKCKLYWVKDDGTLESKDFTVVGNNIVFTTDHFSYWALVNESSDSLVEGNCGDNLTYSYNSDTKTLTITGEGDMWDWKPETTPWWDYKENINCVKIEKSVTNIGNFAFAGFTALSDLYLSDSITSIGASAFALCTSLTTIELPDSINTINSSAFYNCKSLSGITLPDSVTTLGDTVFANCIKLESFVFPSNVTSIGTYLFEGCTSLGDVEFSESMNTIPSAAFSGCIGLKEIEIPAHITSIEAYAFKNCSNLIRVTILNNQVCFYADVFNNCDKLVLYGYKHSTTQTYAEECDLSFVPLESNKPISGDVNGDGIADAGDAVLISRYDAGFITLTAEQLKSGDVNNDGEVDAGDAVLISRYDARLISTLN